MSPSPDKSLPHCAMNKSSHFDIRPVLCLFCFFWCVVGVVAFVSYTFGPAFAPKPMGQVSYHFGPGGLVSVVVWSSVMSGVVWAISRAFSWPGQIKRLLMYNTAVLIFFYGIWFWGWYMSEYWMHFIDIGAPWSWITLLCGSSFIGSLLILRKPVFAAILKSLTCALGILVAAATLWFFSMPFFDPYF